MTVPQEQVSREARRFAADLIRGEPDGGKLHRTTEWLIESVTNGGHDHLWTVSLAARFEATIRADERARVLEEAAKVARDYAAKARNRQWVTHADSVARAAQHIATAIRALKDQQPGASS